MSLTDGKSWGEENRTRARRLGAICSLLAFIVAVILLHSEIREFFSAHSWWQDAFAFLAGLALPVLAGFELHHSGEANKLRREANRLRAEEVHLQEMIGELQAEKAGHLGKIAHLEKERNEHLAQIAVNTQRPVTQAERNAEILRKYLRAMVSVSEAKSIWNTTPEIVEVADNIVTLFSPYNRSSYLAWCVKVHCDDLQIIEIPDGSCPLRLTVLKRYGPDVRLGEITRWEDRFQSTASPVFNKGDTISVAYFEKIGTSEKRSLFIYTSKNDTNSFIFEASTGVRYFGNNVDISIRFMAMQVECLEVGFTRKNFRPGDGKYRLHVW
jgi:hypothetical protein